jgi:hypothetical protein
MKRKTRIKTEIEVREVWIISDPQEAAPVSCQICASPQCVLLAPEVMATLTGISLRNLFRLVEAGQVHYLEQADGSLLICPNSLPADPEAIAAGRLLPSA